MRAPQLRSDLSIHCSSSESFATFDRRERASQPNCCPLLSVALPLGLCLLGGREEIGDEFSNPSVHRRRASDRAHSPDRSPAWCTGPGRSCCNASRPVAAAHGRSRRTGGFLRLSPLRKSTSASVRVGTSSGRSDYRYPHHYRGLSHARFPLFGMGRELCYEGSAKVVEAMIFPNRYRQVTEKERDHDPKAG